MRENQGLRKDKSKRKEPEGTPSGSERQSQKTLNYQPRSFGLMITPLPGRQSRTNSVLSMSSRKVRTLPSTNAVTTTPGYPSYNRPIGSESCYHRVLSPRKTARFERSPQSRKRLFGTLVIQQGKGILPLVTDTLCPSCGFPCDK